MLKSKKENNKKTKYKGRKMITNFYLRWRLTQLETKKVKKINTIRDENSEEVCQMLKASPVFDPQ